MLSIYAMYSCLLKLLLWSYFWKGFFLDMLLMVLQSGAYVSSWASVGVMRSNFYLSHRPLGATSTGNNRIIVDYTASPIFFPGSSRCEPVVPFSDCTLVYPPSTSYSYKRLQFL